VISFGYPGDIVGFPSLGLHHTDCDVLVDATLQPYRASVLQSGKTDPQLHQALMTAALQEISEIQDHVMMLGQKTAAEKVACFICSVGTRTGTGPCKGRQVPLPMSRADIADFLGLTTETVCRTLTQFRKEGCISMQGAHMIVIENPDMLRGLCQRTD
jgi:CRP-like cAMP-binding protein